MLMGRYKKVMSMDMKEMPMKKKKKTKKKAKNTKKGTIVGKFSSQEVWYVPQRHKKEEDEEKKEGKVSNVTNLQAYNP